MPDSITEKDDYKPENEYVELGVFERNIHTRMGSIASVEKHTLWHCLTDGAVVIDREQHDEFLRVAVLATMKHGLLAGAYGTTH